MARAASDKEIFSAYERVCSLINVRVYDDTASSTRDWDESIADAAKYKGDVELLALYEKHLRSDCRYSLDDVYGAYKTFKHSGYSSPIEQVTEETAYIYRMLLDEVTAAWQKRTAMNDREILCAAMIHGKPDDVSIGLMLSVIRERLPVNGDEFLSILEQVRSAGSPSLSSGVL